METVFGTAFEYKLIYVFAINDEAHKGLLKIGDTTIQSDASIDALFPNCKALNQAALSRIKQYTNTAGISAQLLHTELAVRLVKGKDGQQVKSSPIKVMWSWRTRRSISGSFSVSGPGISSTTIRPCQLLHRWAILSTKVMFGAF